MKQINRYIATLIILLFGLSGCATDEDKVSGKGTICIGVNLDTSVKTKAGEDPIKLTIVKSDKDGKPVPESPMYEYDLTTDRSREISLNADTYLLTAIVGNDPKGSPASEPYYVGTKIVTLTAGKTEKITMDCKLTTAVIVVDYSGLGAYDLVEDYETIVENSTGNITFRKDKSTKGYFVAGKALSVTFRYKVNGAWIEKAMPEKITTLEPQHQYTIKYFIEEDGSTGSTGSAGIGIEIKNPSEEDVQIDITIPLNLSVQITPEATKATIKGLIQTNTGIGSVSASFKYRVKNEAWESVTLASNMEAEITNLQPGQLYEYEFVWPDNSLTGNFVTTPIVSAWSSFAMVKPVNGVDDASKLSLKYKETGTDAWQNGDLMKLTGLKPETSYDFVFSYDGADNKSETFTTEIMVPLRNGSFDVWNQNGKIWYAGTQEDANSKNCFWDSANPATAAFGFVPTTPEDSDRGKVAKLSSQEVKLLGGFIKKLAAGNMYIGKFGKVVGTSGAEINFGREWNTRPTALHGWFKYAPGNVNYQGGSGPNIKNQPDICTLYIALACPSQPVSEELAYLVDNTKINTFIDYTPANKDIIAYGELPAERCNGTNNVWEEFDIPLVYRDLERKPTHIIVVASASKYGDYFTGSTSSVMLIDDFELIYGDNPVTQ